MSISTAFLPRSIAKVNTMPIRHHGLLKLIVGFSDLPIRVMLETGALSGKLERWLGLV